ATQYATTQMRQFLEGGGRFTNLEFKTFNERNPNLETDPRAIEKIFNFISRVSRVTYQEQQALGMYKHLAAQPGGPDITNFPAFWNQQLIKNGVIKLGPEAK